LGIWSVVIHEDVFCYTGCAPVAFGGMSHDLRQNSLPYRAHLSTTSCGREKLNECLTDLILCVRIRCEVGKWEARSFRAALADGDPELAPERTLGLLFPKFARQS
jgi:hypothetical protein